MSRSEQVRLGIDGLNARAFAEVGRDFADDVKFHAPGLNLDVEGRETALKFISEFVEQADVHYDVEQIVEHGNFVVAFTRSTGELDGRRVVWDLCQVLRYQGDLVAETWVLRGGAPQPASD